MFKTKLEEKIIPFLKELCHHIKKALVGRRALNRIITVCMNTTNKFCDTNSKTDCISFKSNFEILGSGNGTVVRVLAPM